MRIRTIPGIGPIDRCGVPGLRSGVDRIRTGARFRGMARPRARPAFDRRQDANGACRQDWPVRHASTARRRGHRRVSAVTRKGIDPNGRLARLPARMPRKKGRDSRRRRDGPHDRAVVARRRNAGGIRSSNPDDATWNGILRGRLVRGEWRGVPRPPMGQTIAWSVSGEPCSDSGSMSPRG